VNEVEGLYPLIAEKLVGIIPDEWKKIYLYAEVAPDARITYFYFESATLNKIVYSRNIPEVYNVDRKIFDKLFGELRDLFTRLHEEFSKQAPAPWTNLTMHLEHTGKFNIDYGYETHDFAPDEKQAIWKYEVLGIYPSDDSFYRKTIDEYIKNKKVQE
jgi:uncharacterized protein (TIGR01741 family)